MRPRGAPTVTTISATSSPSTRTPFRAIENEYGVPARLRAPGGARGLELAVEGGVLVAHRLAAGLAKDGLAQPLQPEQEQERADQATDEILGQRREPAPDHGDDRREGQER